MIRTPTGGVRPLAICLDEKGLIGKGLEYDGFHVSSLGRRPGFDFRIPFSLSRAAKKSGATILHCHQYTPWFYGVLAKLFYPSLKIIVTEHGRFYPDLPSKKRQFFNRIFHHLTNRIVAVSPAVHEALVQVDAFPADRVEVV
ncbi:glycosyltransferase family 4 protein, partial [Okeania sp. SIO1H5]|uniref:glycosyltransferase family 4 protein n=1 Tax=Okeania sp. SIO1H5 TaxID=2607777 RepID=UPI002579CF16